MNKTLRKMKWHAIAGWSALLLAAGSLAACGQSGSGARGGQADQTKNGTDAAKTAQAEDYQGGAADLLIVDVNTGTTDEQFQKFFVEPLAAKHPEIHLTKSADSLDKLIAAGTFPDLVLVSNASLATVLEANIPEDLTPMIKKYKIDLGTFEPEVVRQTQKLGDQKAFYGMPFAMNYGAMIYNRNIFDKFGVPYPKDVMTYEEALELGKKLTRTDGGVNYIGIMPPDLRQMYWQYGVPVFNKSTGKAFLTSDKHVRVFSLLKQFYSVPGYMQDGKYSYSTDLFFKEQRMAMYPNWIAAFISFFRKAGTQDAFQWDLTAHPGYSDRPGFGKEVDYHMAVVNQSGKHKEAAYQVLLSLISQDVQTRLSRAGRLSVLNNPAIRSVYGADSDLFRGKNLQAIFKVSPSPLPDASKYDPKINALLIGEVVKNVMVGGTDINTALRNAEEKANKEIIEPQ